VGLEADLQLVRVLVIICVSLRKAAEVHSIESKDLLLIQDEFEGALLELMNCSAMDVPENVTRVLCKGIVERDVVPDHVVRARTLCYGPLYLCVENDLTKILSTPQINRFISTVFYTPLKQTTALPVRNLLDIFQLRSASNSGRSSPSVMFAVECALMPLLCLSMVLFLRIAGSSQTCVDNMWDSLDSLCAHYGAIQNMLIVYLVSRVLYELGELDYTFTNHWREGTTTWRVVYELICDLGRHIIFDAWNVVDSVNMLCLSLWAYNGFRDNRILTWSVISLGLVILRFVSLWPVPGQLMVKIIAVVRDLIPFAFLLILSMLGCGLVFHFAFLDNDRFSTFQGTMIVLFHAAMGSHDFDVFDGDVVGIVMMVVYMLLLYVVFFKLMDVRVSVSHETLNASAPEMWCRSQARNTREFLLIKEWNPLCMLPPPLNILAVLVWLLFDFLPYCYQVSQDPTWYFPMGISRFISTPFRLVGKLVFMPRDLYFAVKNACFHRTTAPLGQDGDKTASTNSRKGEYVLSCAGTFSDAVIAVITAPYHAVVEVYSAYQNVAVGIYKIYFTAVLLVTWPFWILCFFFMIIFSALFRFKDKTYVTSIFGGNIVFRETPLVSYRLGYTSLYAILLVSAMFLLVFICPLRHTGIEFYLANDSSVHYSTARMDIGLVFQDVGHQVIFHATVYLLLIAAIEGEQEFSRETARPGSMSRTRIDVLYKLVGVDKWGHLTRIGFYLLLMFYDLQLLSIAEVIELLGFGYRPMLWLLRPSTVQSSHHDRNAKALGWTDIKGRTRKDPNQSAKLDREAMSKDVMEIKVIRASLGTKGLTIFGTNTQPFVVVKYLRANRQTDLQTSKPVIYPPVLDDAVTSDGDVFYTKTVTTNTRAPEYHQSFEFLLRKGDLEIEFRVYDRVGDHVRYLYGTTCDIRQWIANRRFESPVLLHDNMGRLLKDNLQITVKVKKYEEFHPEDKLGGHNSIKRPSVLFGPDSEESPMSSGKHASLFDGNAARTLSPLSPRSSRFDMTVSCLRSQSCRIECIMEQCRCVSAFHRRGQRKDF
jgi:hypothetical protein